MISTTILLVLTGAALSTFQNALMVNDSASQLADANQNLRAGMNQLIKDVMQAGRIIGPEGIPVPNGAGESDPASVAAEHHDELQHDDDHQSARTSPPATRSAR